MLRQNLFERFGAGSQIPTESPVVKLSPPEICEQLAQPYWFMMLV